MNFGEKLRKQRENSDLSLHEISESTKIRKTYLEALESNDFDALPGGVFAKGYIRSYAEALGVNPEPLLEAYASEKRNLGHGDPDEDDRAAQDAAQAALSRLAGTSDTPSRGNRKVALFGTLGVLGIALIIVAIWFVLRDSEPGPGKSVAAVEPRPVELTEPSVASPMAEESPAEEIVEQPPIVQPPEPPRLEEDAQPTPAPLPDPPPVEKATRESPDENRPVEEPPPPATAQTGGEPGSAAESAREVPANSGDLRVLEFGVGTGVVDRQLVGESNRFAEGTRVWFWTRVIDGESGETIRHVWLRDGRQIGSVQLRLGGEHWRTQSNRTMNQGSAGQWTVEARDAGGRILATAEFDCVAAR